MFTRKPEDGSGGQGGSGSAQSGRAAAVPLRAPQGEAPPTMPARPGVMRPEIVRRARDYGSRSNDDRTVSSYSGGNDGKKLIVGRDIALSGQISSCEKLVVEGRVEANITECSEIEIAEPGTFKGEATIDVAVISGRFEGSLVVRDLLIVHSTGRISGSVRYGQLEIERGGQLEGDVRLIDNSADHSQRRHRLIYRPQTIQATAPDD